MIVSTPGQLKAVSKSFDINEDVNEDDDEILSAVAVEQTKAGIFNEPLCNHEGGWISVVVTTSCKLVLETGNNVDRLIGRSGLDCGDWLGVDTT